MMFSKLATLSALLVSVIATGDKLEKGFTPHFMDWLKANGYEKYGFERKDLKGGAYGGFSAERETISHHPVVFIHGNSDIGAGNYNWQTGFTESIKHF